MSSISAGTTTTTGYVVTSDTTGALVLKTGASGTTAVTVGSDQSVTFAGSQTFSGGTANGVLYLNGSKVATSGSALTFDGTDLQVANGGIYAANGTGSNLSIGFKQSSTVKFRLRYDIAGDSISLVDGSGNFCQTWAQGNTFTSFGIGGSEQMRLTSTGLGIGTSSPGEKLTVAGSISTRGGNSVLFYRGDNTRFGSIYADNDGLNIRQPLNDYIIFEKNDGTNLAILDAAGNLGLGVTPSAWAWPNGSAGALQLQSGAAISAYNATTYLSQNWYYNAGEKYIANGFATRYEQTTGKHAWYTAASGTAGNAISWTQAMTLDASGNLLVGTTSSYGGVLSVNGNIGLSGNGTSNRYIALLGETNAYAGTLMLQAGGGSAGYGGAVVMYGASHASYPGFVYIGASAGVSSAIVFGKGGQGGPGSSEYARIDTSGNLLVGTTSVQQSAQLTVAGTVATNGLISHAGFNGAYQSNKFNFQWTGSAALWVDTTNIGNIATTSDYRLKENVIAQDETGLTRLMQLNPVKFNRKKVGIFTGSNAIEEGFLAHELQAIIPSAVFGEKDALTEDGGIQPQSLNWSPIVSVLVKAMQEQQAIIESLTQRIAALEGQ